MVVWDVTTDITMHLDNKSSNHISNVINPDCAHACSKFQDWFGVGGGACVLVAFAMPVERMTLYTYDKFKKVVMERMGLDDEAAVKMWNEADKIVHDGDEMAVMMWNEADEIVHEVEVVAHEA